MDEAAAATQHGTDPIGCAPQSKVLFKIAHQCYENKVAISVETAFIIFDISQFIILFHCFKPFCERFERWHACDARCIAYANYVQHLCFVIIDGAARLGGFVGGR